MFQDNSKNSLKRSSINLGTDQSSDIGELQIENERLKTTLFLLNQKMKMMEDNEDLTEKWKS